MIYTGTSNNYIDTKFESKTWVNARLIRTVQKNSDKPVSVDLYEKLIHEQM